MNDDDIERIKIAQAYLDSLKDSALGLDFYKHIVDSGFCSYRGVKYKVTSYGKVIDLFDEC